MSNRTVNFLELFKEKKYSTIISIIENEFADSQITSGLLNLRGVCRMMVSDSSESIKLAIEDFRKSYQKETDRTKLIEPIKNLINAEINNGSIDYDPEYIRNHIENLTS